MNGWNDDRDGDRRDGGKDGRSDFERALADALKKLAADEPSRLDFYRDFDASVPPADELFGRLSASGVGEASGGGTGEGSAAGGGGASEAAGEGPGASDGGGRRPLRPLRRRRAVWIASSSVAAAVAIILLVTTVYSPGAFTGRSESSMNMDTAQSAASEDGAAAGASSDSAITADAGVVDGVRPAALPERQSSYEDIYAALSESEGETIRQMKTDGRDGGDVFYEAEVAETAPGPGASAPTESQAPAASESPAKETSDDSAARAENGGETAPEFSDTNAQTEGVQEADVVKTDGKYIYTANSEGICITEAKDGRPEVLSEIPQVTGKGQVYFEMYIDGDRLILIRQGYGNLKDKDGKPVASSADGGVSYPGDRYMIDSSVDVYDVSDRENPRRAGSLSQSGWYADSRMIGDKLYLISTYDDFDYAAVDKDDPRSYVPLFAEDDSQITSKPGEVHIPERPTVMSYTVVSGIDTAKAKFVSHESILGESYTVYASRDNLYLSATEYDSSETEEYGYRVTTNGHHTRVTRLSLKDGQVNAEASADVPGTVNDQFSLDEYGGALRVVTTKDEFIDVRYVGKDAAPIGDIEAKYGKLERYSGVYGGFREERTTGLYVLDMDLKLLGKVDDLAPDEEVYSCRYMGDVAYFVTFRNTDPLFSVDLSDKKRPKIMGKLKIPGFSNYLHPYADGLLFGLGSDADEETGAVGSLKVSMFDNSDPYDVTEKDKLILDDASYTYAAENHKAVLVDARRSLVAFPADEGYVILNYDRGTGFSRVMDVRLDPAGYDDPWYWYNGLRGIFIGEVFYVVAPDSIHAYDMTDGFKAVDSVSLGSGARYVDKDSFELPPGYDYDDVYFDAPVRAFGE